MEISFSLPENLADLVVLVQTVAQFHHKIPTIGKRHSAVLPPQKYLSYFNSIKENIIILFLRLRHIYSLVKLFLRRKQVKIKYSFNLPRKVEITEDECAKSINK